jgi:hypothetical protein
MEQQKSGSGSSDPLPEIQLLQNEEFSNGFNTSNGPTVDLYGDTLTLDGSSDPTNVSFISTSAAEGNVTVSSNAILTADGQTFAGTLTNNGTLAFSLSTSHITLDDSGSVNNNGTISVAVDTMGSISSTSTGTSFNGGMSSTITIASGSSLSITTGSN